MLPNDPMMLLSVINTQLRDNYRSLEDLAEGLDVDVNEIVTKLSALGYEYGADVNRFVKKSF